MATEDDCIRALREAADRLGESPTKSQYAELGLTPASATIQRVMGGWNAAKEASAWRRTPRLGRVWNRNLPVSSCPRGSSGTN